MMFLTLLSILIAHLVLVTDATSICDKYTTALLTTNTAANQYTLLKLIVNTVIIGNYTTPNVGIKVPGILATETYNGETINLLPYFTGSLNTSNVNGIASKVNFLDGGGAAPLKLNEPADDTTSNQYFLVTHLYELFGKLLGCTLQSTNSSGSFPAYSGDASLYETHKFMNLSANEVGYFIQQVGLAAESFGVTSTDATTVGNALTSLFGYRCLQPAAVTYSTADTQSICIGAGCPLAASPNCSAYTSKATTSSSTESICDKYTTALLTDNTAANQYTLLKLIVNTVIIGNYTQPNVGITVPGILATGTYNGETVDLLPYFTGSSNTSNVNGIASKVNFLDGGGAAPLKLNEPADDTTSNQYFLVTHLYELFGKLLGCSLQSTTKSGTFPTYSGDASLYETHKFMNLSAAEVGYFIHQVGLAAESFGVTAADATTVGNALTSLFGYRCLAPTAGVTYSNYSSTQSICIGAGCQLASSPNCSAYTTSEATTSSSSSSSNKSFPTSSIIAIVVSIGGAILLVAIGVAIYFYMSSTAYATADAATPPKAAQDKVGYSNVNSQQVVVQSEQVTHA